MVALFKVAYNRLNNASLVSENNSIIYKVLFYFTCTENKLGSILSEAVLFLYFNIMLFAQEPSRPGMQKKLSTAMVR